MKIVMLMSRSIVPASNQKKKKQEQNYSSGFLCSFYLASLFLWYSPSTACAANDNNRKENTIQNLPHRIFYDFPCFFFCG